MSLWFRNITIVNLSYREIVPFRAMISVGPLSKDLETKSLSNGVIWSLASELRYQVPWPSLRHTTTKDEAWLSRATPAEEGKWEDWRGKWP